MLIEVGKVYLTRSGRKAVVSNQVTENNTVFFRGTLLEAGLMTWNAQGQAMLGSDQADIVSVFAANKASEKQI